MRWTKVEKDMLADVVTGTNRVENDLTIER